MPRKKGKTAVFIMPRSSNAWSGAEALWITVSGWALAAEKILGNAIVISSDRVSNPQEVLSYPFNSKNRASGGRNKKNRFFWMPALLKTFLKDVFAWYKTRNWEILKNIQLPENEIAFVWEQHDLFPGPGRSLSENWKVPFILFVHAPVVWESSKWGVKRYAWGHLLQRFEAKALQRADLVAVVSKEVREKVLQMGVRKDRILISPMGVNPDSFKIEEAESLRFRKKLCVDEKFVIGWIGSFRSFHGLDNLISAFKKISDKYPHAVLLLVGDGLRRNDYHYQVCNLEIDNKVIFTGKKPFSEIPLYLSVFDVAFVGATNATGFHYSPLKLREYMAAGKAVLAPNAGEIPETFEDEVNLKLFTAGDIKSLEEGMEYLILNEVKRKEIALNGKTKIEKTGTWDKELDKALEYLKKIK